MSASASIAAGTTAPRTLAQAARERRDIVSGQVMGEAALVRFVAGPGGLVVPDLARKLPGRGLWVAADRASVETAVKRGAFSRAAKAKLSAPADLADQVETLPVSNNSAWMRPEPTPSACSVAICACRKPVGPHR